MSDSNPAAPANKPTPEPASAIELAYGLLWHVSIDSSTDPRVREARLVLLGELGVGGQARGITAAQARFPVLQGPGWRTPAETPAAPGDPGINYSKVR